MLALLRWLDRSGLVAFHQSKTNGDYLREYPDNNPAEGTFRRFAVSFDLLIYGGGSCGDDAYRRMAGLFEEVQRYARRQ